MSSRILLIEDNEQNRYLAKFLLESRGHTVETASDGQSGIELARTIEAAAIILDIQLPNLDGYATARELRKIPSLQKTPIIAVTSYAMVGDREKALAAGCDGYLEKPIDPLTFVPDIEKFLSANS
ncbi:MAG: response regulator [Verrucomicrobiales bacterium]|nr:response regulator [Verrucomicrobiales bacterium]